jgi:hypothetical protein
VEQTPIYLTKFALARLLKEFAKRCGLDDGFSDILAQIHLQESTIPSTWSEFIVVNCTGCAKNIETCDYMNPDALNCPEGISPADMKAANAMMVESSRVTKCPAWRGIDPALLPPLRHR